MAVKRRRRVLLAVADGVVAADLERRLGGLGLEVVACVATGEEAVRHAVDGRPDVALIDVRLQGSIDGVEAARRIGDRFGIPVVLLGGEDLPKPFGEHDLGAAIERALAGDAAAPSAVDPAFSFDALFQSVPCPTALVDERHRCLRWNRSFGEVFRLAEAVPAGRCLSCTLGLRECAAQRDCSGCPFTPVLDAALAGADVRRRRVEVTLLGPQSAERAVFLASAAPLAATAATASRVAVLVLEDVSELDGLRRLVGAEHSFAGMVGASAAVLEVFDTIRRVASLPVPVLVQGESGTGKELVAKALHATGCRAKARFVAVNCAAMPEGLLESELFGHVRGAFTGANQAHRGRFELADSGTLFLDEVGDLQPSLQAKLLRVLQEGVFEPVGSERSMKVDVRIVSATSKDLKAEIAAGRFREDLFFRLCVIPVTLPPLRERRGDLPLVAEFLLSKMASLAGRPPLRLAPETLTTLLAHPWPGNVRELENVLQYSSIRCPGDVIQPQHLPPAFVRTVSATVGTVLQSRRLTAEAVGSALETVGGNRQRAAELLHVSRATLFRALARFGREGTKPGAKPRP